MSMDTALFHAINGLAGRSPASDWLMLQLGHSTTFLVPTVLAAAYWLWQARREAVIGSVTLGGLLIAGDFLGAQIKHLVERPRPCQVLGTVHQLAACGHTFGFPSNHALNTAAAAAFVQALYPMAGWIVWPVVALAGFSRIYVGAHYPTDVLGGWLIGGLLGGAAGLALRQVFRKMRMRRVDGAVGPSMAAVANREGEDMRRRSTE